MQFVRMYIITIEASSGHHLVPNNRLHIRPFIEMLTPPCPWTMEIENYDGVPRFAREREKPKSLRSRCTCTYDTLYIHSFHASLPRYLATYLATYLAYLLALLQTWTANALSPTLL